MPTSKYGATTTAAEVVHEVDLHGRRTLVTGASAAYRWADDGITANALMPGNVASTALARHMRPDDLADFGETTDLELPPVKTVEQGAATSVLLAASPDVEGVTGRYFEDCAQAHVVDERVGHTGGVAAYALDATNAERLWQISNELIR